MNRTNSQTKLTPDQVLEIVARRKAGEGVRALARSLSISSATICGIMGGHSWSKVTGIPRSPRKTHYCGQNHPNSKLTEAQVWEILNRRQAGETYYSISRSFGISQMAISSIVNGKTWSHITGVALLSKPRRRRLTATEIHDIRARYKNGESQSQIANSLSLSPTSVCQVVNYKTYRHVNGEASV